VCVDSPPLRGGGETESSKISGPMKRKAKEKGHTRERGIWWWDRHSNSTFVCWVSMFNRENRRVNTNSQRDWQLHTPKGEKTETKKVERYMFQKNVIGITGNFKGGLKMSISKRELSCQGEKEKSLRISERVK